MAIPEPFQPPVDIDPNDPIASFHRLRDHYNDHPEDIQKLSEIQVGNPISLGPPVPSGRAMAAKLIRQAQAASGDWLENTQHPRRDPVAAALAQTNKYKARTKEAIDQGRWEGAMNNVNIDEMMETVRSVGQAHYSSGLAARERKIIRVFESLQPDYISVSQTIQAMPQDTDIQREARLTAARRLMIEVGNRRRGVRGGGGAAARR